MSKTFSPATANGIHSLSGGRLMSLLAPARGMPVLPAKGGFSRPSLITLCGVSSRPLGLGLRTARPIGNHCDYSPHRKHFLPLESRVFQLLGWVFILNELRYDRNSSQSMS